MFSCDLGVSIKFRGETFVSKRTKYSRALTAALCREGESCVKKGKEAHGESIIPGDFKSFASGKCDFVGACFEKDLAIFSSYLPLLPLLISSSPLHLCPLLYYSEEGSSHHGHTPLCTQVQLRPYTSPVCVCVCTEEHGRYGLIELDRETLYYSTCTSHFFTPALGLMGAAAWVHQFW